MYILMAIISGFLVTFLVAFIDPFLPGSLRSFANTNFLTRVGITGMIFGLVGLGGFLSVVISVVLTVLKMK